MAKKGKTSRPASKLGVAEIARGKPRKAAKRDVPKQSDLERAVASLLAEPVKTLVISNQCLFALDVFVSKSETPPLTWQQLTGTVPAKTGANPGTREYDLTNYPAIETGLRKVKVQKTGSPQTPAPATAGTNLNYSQVATGGKGLYQVYLVINRFSVTGPTYS